MNNTVPRHRHVVSVDDMDTPWIQGIFSLATSVKTAFLCGPDSPEWALFSGALQNRMMHAIFYEASTRTRFSFEDAMKFLGGLVTTTEAAKLFSSAAKGETLYDTIQTNARYGIGRSIIVLRHHERGSAREAAMIDVCPIINAGDGDGEHPTQALLDTLTIIELSQGNDEKTLTLVGDLKHGRTVHSLIKLAIKLNVVTKFQLVAPAGFELPEEYLAYIKNAGLQYSTASTLSASVVAESDVVYMTRAQKERAPEGTTISGDAYALTEELALHLKGTALVMHPLPRNEEVPRELDKLAQAKYFDQVENGLYLRMALLLWVFDKVPAL